MNKVFAGFVAAVVFSSIALLTRLNAGSLKAIEGSGRTFLAAVGARDGAGACARMTSPAQSEFATTHHAGGCPEAVEVLTGGLSEAELSGLARSYKSRYFERDSHFGHVSLGENALQISELVLVEAGGRWLIAQLL